MNKLTPPRRQQHQQQPRGSMNGINHHQHQHLQQTTSIRMLRRQRSLAAMIGSFLAVVVFVVWRKRDSLSLIIGGGVFFEPALLLTTATSSSQQGEQQQPTATTAVHLLQQSLPSHRYKVHLLDGVASTSNLESSPNTIVVAHLPIPSNPPTDTYYAWVSHLLTVQDNMIIFTQGAHLVERMKLLRSQWPKRTVIIEILDLNDLPISNLNTNADNNASSSQFWSDQLEMDPHKDEVMSYQFYWIWLSKSWFVSQAHLQFNYFDSDFFMYSDMDLFQTKKFLNKRLVQKTQKVPPQSLLWMAKTVPNPPSNPIQNIQDDDNDNEDNDDIDTNDNANNNKKHSYHLGAMSAGKADAWLEFHTKFALTIDAFIAHNLFLGKDDVLLQSTCQQYTHLCAYILAQDVAPDDSSARAALRTVLSKKGVGAYKLYRGQPGYKNNRGQGGRQGKKLKRKKITG